MIAIIRKVVFREIKFGSFVKLFCTVSALTGLIVGIYYLIKSLFVVGFYTDYLKVHYTGFTAGVVKMFIDLLGFTILGLMGSIITYWPFKKLITKKFGYNIYGEFEVFQIQLLSETDALADVVKEEGKENI